MKLIRTLELMKEYTDCPNCGNGYIGNGEGTLHVTDDSFIRTCKCGWKIEINDCCPICKKPDQNGELCEECKIEQTEFAIDEGYF